MELGGKNGEYIIDNTYRGRIFMHRARTYISSLNFPKKEEQNLLQLFQYINPRINSLKFSIKPYSRERDLPS